MIILSDMTVHLIRDSSEDFIDATVARALDQSTEIVERNDDGTARILTPRGAPASYVVSLDTDVT